MPRPDAPIPPTSTPSPARPIGGRGERTKMAKVLIVADHPGMAALLSKALGTIHDLHVVDNADAAADAADRADAVVLDLHAANPGNLQLLHRLRTTRRHPPVLVLDGRHGPHDRTSALAAGADDYLPVPFRAADLTTQLNDLLLDSRPGTA